MAERYQIYKCEICGNIIEVLHGGAGTLVCCGADMILLEENTTDAATEKHVPVVERTKTGTKVTVGEVLHPMLEEHFIEWIQLIANGKSYRQFLNPKETPAAEFPVKADNAIIREYCNLHGLWKA
ncbi:MAG: desulfoferrodoxin [bacterium]